MLVERLIIHADKVIIGDTTIDLTKKIQLQLIAGDQILTATVTRNHYKDDTGRQYSIFVHDSLKIEAINQKVFEVHSPENYTRAN